MKRILLFATSLLMGTIAWAEESSLKAGKLMENNFLASKVSGFTGVVNMTLIDAKGQQRIRKLAIWSKLKNGSTEAEVLMRFDQPADIKDTGFLQIENSSADDDIWIYLPALGKTRRLVANNKRDSFFGTDFSYGDILLPSVHKYNFRYIKNELIDGTNCHLIEALPTSDQVRNESGYSRKLIWLDSGNFIERKVEYFDAKGILIKTQTTFDAKLIEPSRNRWIAMRREMYNHQTSHKTLYNFEQLTLDAQLNESLFTPRNLEH